MSGITDEERARVDYLLSSGKVLPMPPGARLDAFDPVQLAEALESQATRAKFAFDVPMVDLRMSADDALALAGWLRQAPRSA